MRGVTPPGSDKVIQVLGIRGRTGRRIPRLKQKKTGSHRLSKKQKVVSIGSAAFAEN